MKTVISTYDKENKLIDAYEREGFWFDFILETAERRNYKIIWMNDKKTMFSTEWEGAASSIIVLKKD